MSEGNRNATEKTQIGKAKREEKRQRGREGDNKNALERVDQG